MNKIIEWANVWTCDNLDWDAPINWEGYLVLFSDNTQQRVDDLEEVAQHEVATEEEKKDFYRNFYNCTYKGDYIDIIKGKMKGQRKKVVSTFTYVVPNTYGKVTTDYFVFEDGTKTADTNTNYYTFNFERNHIMYCGRL